MNKKRSARSSYDARLLAAATVGICIALASLLVSPILLTKRGFVDDWLNHLWLVGYQSGYIHEHWVPTYFISGSSKLGMLYPSFVFYGGSLYGFWGYVGAVFGVETAFQASIIVAVAWIVYALAMASRCVGVSWWLSFLPGTLVVTSAYFTTVLFGRGAWAELFALAGLTSLAAVILMTLWKRQFGWKLSALAIASSATWTGSHNITLMWGAVFLTVFVCVTLPILVFSRRRRPCMRVLISLVLSFLTGVLINSWFLFPDLLFAGRTLLGGDPVLGWVINDPLVSLTNALALTRKTPFYDDPFLRSHYTQLPVAAFVAIALVLLLCISMRRQPTWRLGVVYLALASAFSILVLRPSWWSKLPSVLWNVQFTFRLESYVAIALGFSMACSLWCLMHQKDRRLQVTVLGVLLFVVLLSTAQALNQSWRSMAWYSDASEPLVRDRGLVLKDRSVLPVTFYDPGSFRQRPSSEPPVVNGPTLLFRAAPFGSFVEARSNVRLGRIVRTNVASSPFLRFRGVVEVGQTQDGFAIVRVTSDRGHFTARGDGGRVLPVAQLVSVLALVFAFALVAFFYRRERKRSDFDLAS